MGSTRESSQGPKVFGTMRPAAQGGKGFRSVGGLGRRPAWVRPFVRQYYGR